MRLFYDSWPISQTPSAKSQSQTPETPPAGSVLSKFQPVPGDAHVDLILCAQKDEALAKYVLEGLPNKTLAREYKLALPSERTLARDLEMTQKRLRNRRKK